MSSKNCEKFKKNNHKDGRIYRLYYYFFFLVHLQIVWLLLPTYMVHIFHRFSTIFPIFFLFFISQCRIVSWSQVNARGQTGSQETRVCHFRWALDKAMRNSQRQEAYFDQRYGKRCIFVVENFALLYWGPAGNDKLGFLDFRFGLWHWLGIMIRCRIGCWNKIR